MSAARSRSNRVAYQAASWCLGYPDEDLIEQLPILRAALAEQADSEPTRLLRDFVDHLALTPLDALTRHYVEVFDLSRKHALYLSYWTDGDTRRRGEVLGSFKRRYRDSGFLVQTGGELPDFLPMVLEYASLVDPDDGYELLQAYRPSLELLRIALQERESPYAGVVTAVCTTLPGASPADRVAVMQLAGAGPPTESVGLEPYDPRLLPIHETTQGMP
ncbi:nitrate reductase molybdenum cofactor assembly chaperone [Solicola gregarius]|uniref:Nitrate reductase molybdenum cofactor assembly chaperone n=1 Tax=Solicola gregarius TaxID=2908642 RepID=A0AA46TML4_9ACTN|nr:nitrate reductase molybdenum cofactor assembly chaperone [Solicola gregarius]UYM07714.1 nitrate reductase molybdenum cofactor assembly chaperone [Solicola gregarius]